MFDYILNDMFAMQIISKFISILVAFTAFFSLTFLLRRIDKSVGFDFKAWMDNDEHDSEIGRGVYLGFRIFAVSYLLATIIS